MRCCRFGDGILGIPGLSASQARELSRKRTRLPGEPGPPGSGANARIPVGCLRPANFGKQTVDPEILRAARDEATKQDRAFLRRIQAVTGRPRELIRAAKRPMPRELAQLVAPASLRTFSRSEGIRGSI